MKERTALSIRLVLTHLILPPLLIFISLIVNGDSFLLTAITETVLLIVFFAGYWEFFKPNFRVIYCCVIQFLTIAMFAYKMSLKDATDFNMPLVIILAVFQVILIIGLIKILIVIFCLDSQATEIEFPLKNGKYLITDGGNSKISRLMNYHYHSANHKKRKTNNSMKFATDIVRIDTSQSTFFPFENTDYPIFGAKVYCPFGGTIIKVVNDINDNIPFAGNYPYNTGNTIIIKNNDLYFLLGHLRKGSILVMEGDTVKENDLLAECGNSGFSERPHIHMQLINSKNDNFWTGSGQEITFRNKTLYKNRIIRT